jgi:hypothetical protein
MTPETMKAVAECLRDLSSIVVVTTSWKAGDITAGVAMEQIHLILTDLPKIPAD